jgi:hypothetical protein
MPESQPPVRGDSALLVPIPEAEPVVGALRLKHDPAASRGVPAHVTVLFPFVPAARIDASLHEQLLAMFDGIATFDYRFDRVDRFGSATVFLAPSSANGFVALTDAVANAWPEFPPFSGAFAEVIPHLTVGDGLAAGMADRLAAEVRVSLAAHGPVAGRASEVWLMTEGADGTWSLAERCPLAIGGPPS